MKRAFDAACSVLGLLVLSPLFLLIAIAIQLDTPGSVFFRGMRTGKDGTPFRIFKFRTMIPDAAISGPAITTRDDARVTSVGRILRSLKLDELPQLINVFLGEMSLVGPRPEDPRYIARYTPEQREILKYRPGITSPASIAYRKESSMVAKADWENKYLLEISPKKLAIDLEYFCNATFWSDLKILFMTIVSIIRN